MSTPQYKGKIKNTYISNGGIAYDRVAPGVTFPSDNLSDEELAQMSSEVVTYKEDDTSAKD